MHIARRRSSHDGARDDDGVPSANSSHHIRDASPSVVVVRRDDDRIRRGRRRRRRRGTTLAFAAATAMIVRERPSYSFLATSLSVPCASRSLSLHRHSSSANYNAASSGWMRHTTSSIGPRRRASISIVRRDAVGTNDEDENDDGRSVGTSDDDVVAPTSSNRDGGDDDDDDDDSWTSSRTRRQPTLAELEDYEEARLAELERKMTIAGGGRGGSRGEGGVEGGTDASMTIGGGVPLSNLYSDVYASEISARFAKLGASSSSSSSSYASGAYGGNDPGGGRGKENDGIGRNDVDDYEYPPPLSPQREMYLARKRDLLQNGRFNEMFAEEDRENADRQDKIRLLMEEDDRAWKEERRRRLLGKYADVGSREEVERLLDEDRTREARETELKVDLAKRAGVTLTMLEPAELIASPSSSSSSSSSVGADATNGDGKVVDGRGGINGYDTNAKKSTFNPSIGVMGKASWFDTDDDIDLEAEFQSLPLRAATADVVAAIGDDAYGRTADEDIGIDSTSGEDGPRFVNGRLTSREQLMGISVGSAGGWSLEVFPGDYVVHRKYGIGKYEKTVLKPKSKLTPEERSAAEERRKEIINGLMGEGRQLEEIQRVVETFGTDRDDDPISNPLSTFLEINYSDAAVHVPIDRAYRLSRYRAGDTVIKPKLSRVKGEAWSKAKLKVEVSTIQMAEDVLALYATRETLSRPPFDPSLEGRVREFSKSFAFEPTPDQKKCFEDVENDMVWRSRPMDRLICGDVGFGKTEVAMRALFRAVANGRQAALLAPTGVLAAQHYKNIIKRMGEGTEHGFKIALLRGGMGKNTKKGRELRTSISAGEVNIVVGTHALLSNGMGFHDLGLLTIDEEQRFGVNQKERLKLICNCVDVLTLSATPIPRTLQMSLSGIRDTSTIRSPPPMRKPTVSYVQEFEETLVRDAIERELARDGQCYYVVPRISQLEEAQLLLKKIFPKLRVIQAHGRMARGTAEENVAAFAEGNYDVLLATTVIENGVDIPRVNTMIIQNAQAFGMSTLYQLRGRVGRSDLQAYAYFFHKNDFLTEQSAQRLQAMADLHELGSGFDVANRDLEIRGAGSLLGTEQSGMAARVGFDLYMRMLKKSMRQLRGLDLPVVPRSNVLLPGGEGSIEWDDENHDTNADRTGGSSYLIPETYIEDDKERSREESLARLAESTQRLVEITNTWKEKYGAMPGDLQNNLKALHLHTCLRQLGIDVVGIDKSSGDCILRSPGLRPRHWAMICSQLPKGAPPKGLDVIFPARFTFSDDDTEITGGRKLDLEELLTNPKYNDDEEEWDALDEEEVEAMKEISSAVNIKSLSEIEVNNYPRFVVKQLGKTVKNGARVDSLLKVLLPPSKVVYQKQQRDKEKAKVAAELREKRDLIAKQKKEHEKSSRRMGYQY